MSLKAFHLVFISFSILLALVFGAWLVRQYQLMGGIWNLLFGLSSFGAAASLAVYERYFLRKTRHISYL